MSQAAVTPQTQAPSKGALPFTATPKRAYRVPPPSSDSPQLGGGKGVVGSPGTRGGPRGKSGGAGPRPPVTSRAWVLRGAPRPGYQGQRPSHGMAPRAGPSPFGASAHLIPLAVWPTTSGHFKLDKEPPSGWSGFLLGFPGLRFDLSREAPPTSHFPRARGCRFLRAGDPRTNPPTP